MSIRQNGHFFARVKKENLDENVFHQTLSRHPSISWSFTRT